MASIGPDHHMISLKEPIDVPIVSSSSFFSFTPLIIVFSPLHIFYFCSFNMLDLISLGVTMRQLNENITLVIIG
jgi:hypothetical protein